MPSIIDDMKDKTREDIIKAMQKNFELVLITTKNPRDLLELAANPSRAFAEFALHCLFSTTINILAALYRSGNSSREEILEAFDTGIAAYRKLLIEHVNKAKERKENI